MANGMKVYHFPHMPIVMGDVAFISFFNSLSLIRQILIREHIDIVHGHQSTSILQHIVMLAAKSYGIKPFSRNIHFMDMATCKASISTN
jgi:phosphatidylinositol N-acetylglucosaminyltransferase subunit A